MRCLACEREYGDGCGLRTAMIMDRTPSMNVGVYSSQSAVGKVSCCLAGQWRVLS